ncbi:LPO_1073/Vpar_1526 family protein [Streptomyces sp. DH10]|uniref:LPO_1073/Vpar_1526 family protein n=1 Tax=Streptomyces sp. DH10 TaxID=3040121 RepID=UPI0024417554|nr:LPO_1073/Vpar_1526 family protein [Streptomyces sp. DH10]MDG9707770.1 hypothetical protein [Streptomyces sp. DH10]
MTQWQSQRGGDGSTNIQGEHVKYIERAQYGISYDDAKSIAMDVYERNITKFTQIAREVARERAEEFTGKLLRDISPEALEALKDPDVQRGLFFAQQEFACSGDDEVGDTLVKLLMERITDSRDGMRRLVLNEALRIAAKLTPDHISLLTCNFILKYVSFGNVRTVGDISEQLDAALQPFCGDVFNIGQADIDYLLGTGCLTGSSGFIQEAMSPGRYMGINYPGIFSTGFTLDDFPDGHLLLNTPLIEKHPTADGRYRVCAISEDDLNSLISEHDLEGVHQIAKNALKSRVQPEHVILESILECTPHLRPFFRRWKSMGMSSYMSSASAVAIAHANARRISEGQSPASLDNWLSPRGEFD